MTVDNMWVEGNVWDLVSSAHNICTYLIANESAYYHMNKPCLRWATNVHKSLFHSSHVDIQLHACL